MRAKKNQYLICLAALCGAFVLGVSGCQKSGQETTPDADGQQVSEDMPLPGGELGEGEHAFAFTVVDLDGNETAFTIHTDQTIVGDALQELGLIDGEEGDYGLYVKTVNGITADYDKDKTYWAFYIDGEYALTGVDQTEIADGANYSFQVEK